MVLLGIFAALMSALAFVAAVIRAALGDYDKSHNNEMCAIGWAVLAVLCVR